MSSDFAPAYDRRAIALEYFRRLDAGEDMSDLFSDTSVIYFPKFGVARGRAEIERMWSEVGVLYQSIRHFKDFLNVIEGDDLLFVEGLSDGVAGDGTVWTGGETHAGRWCDVMDIRGGRIERLHIYLDPDYAGADVNRYPWLQVSPTPRVEEAPEAPGAPTASAGAAEAGAGHAARRFMRALAEGDDVRPLLHEHAHAYFPKWGVARGRTEVGQLIADVRLRIDETTDHLEYANVVVDGTRVGIEGLTSGTTADGRTWRAGTTLAGRYCAVLDVAQGLVERVFIYLDPDLGGEDTDRYPWLPTRGGEA